MLEGLFRNTLSPVQWSLLLAIPPAILALYFLKLKRMPVEVPSTYLWRKSIEDLRVNSFWQRLRQSLLLLLQLLIVALAIFALLRPGWEGTELNGERVIFVIDNSASMGAEDVDDAENRLADAKQKVAGLIDQLDSDMSAMLIAFADAPQVIQQFTGSRGVLRERLESIELTAQPTDLLDALKLAGGLANPGQMTMQDSGVEVEVVEPVTTSLYIFSDGRFADVEGFDLGGLDPVYVPVGSTEAANLAITAFSTRRNEVRPEEREAFVQVTNFTEADQEFVVEVQLDGQFLDAKSSAAKAGESASLSFPLADAPPGKLTASLDFESLQSADDKLAVDNVAYAGLNPQEQGKVLLVTNGNKVLEAALSTERAARIADLTIVSPDKLASDEYKKSAQSGEYALIIYDVCSPEEMPRSHTFFIGSRPPTAAWGGKSEEGADAAEPRTEQFPQVIDWNRAHPLLAYVELNDLWIFESQLVDAPTGGVDLIDTGDGSLMAIAPRESYEDVVLGFPIIVNRDGVAMGNTRWFRRRSFPTFWLNTLSYLVGQLSGDANSQAAPGEPVEFRPVTNVPEVVVRSPAGKEVTLTRAGDTTFQYQDTAEPGVYEVLERGQVSKRFAINLFDRQESDIRLRATQQEVGTPVEAIRIGYTDVAAQAGGAPARKELWQLLLVLALVVLMAEWYIYNRRVYI
ncbi:hypothetical protein KOR34_25550 [Posidoniimonas corsicana]|uniref:VWFA domain-containing protein n=1 Tax=Posidoniimonas corsicana TaxID=1938618 RepID=A0A5C5VHL0_9BACT|nr:BatA and WFA domain-containing protein [Posidoniimonas corsicana]TWT37601.1 hypothetical protein KOR34_25550 [Posidoniimonas corsicana]